MSTTAESILKTVDTLRAQKANFYSLYRRVSTYFMPMESDQDAMGEAKSGPNGQEFDYPSESEGIRSARVLSSGLASNTVTRGQEWFALRSVDETLNKNTEVAAYWDACRDRMLKAMQNSNFGLEYPEMVMQFVVFGTGVMFSELTPSKRLSFRRYSARYVLICEGPEGQIDSIYREFEMTASQAVRMFAEGDLSKTIRDDAEDASRRTIKHKFIHAVYPRAVTEGAEGNRAMPWVSYYIEVAEKGLVTEGGYESFPFAVPRCYKRENEPYGRSPAMEALGDMRQLCRASEDYVDAIEMAMVPPLLLPSTDALEHIELTPGAVVYYDPTQGGKPVFYQTSGNLQVGLDFLERKSAAVREAFYVDLFMMLEERKNMSATEVVERVNEKIQAITTIVSRLHSEFFTPLIERVFRLLFEAEMFPEPPGILEGKDYEVVYTSRLDAKLAQNENLMLVSTIEDAGRIAAVGTEMPEIKTIFDFDASFRRMARNNNLDQELLRSEEDTEQLREAEAQAQQQAMAQQAMVDKVAPVDINSPVQPGTPLEAALNHAAEAGNA